MDRIHLTSTMPSLSYQIHPRSARHCQSHSFTTCRVLGNGLAGSFPSLFGTLNIYHLLAAKKCTHIEIACPVLPEDFFCHVQRAQRRQALRWPWSFFWFFCALWQTLLFAQPCSTSTLNMCDLRYSDSDECCLIMCYSVRPHWLSWNLYEFCPPVLRLRHIQTWSARCSATEGSGSWNLSFHIIICRGTRDCCMMLHEIAMEECCGPWQDTKCISQVQRVLQVLNAHCQPCWCLLCVMLRHDLSQSARDFQIIRQNEAVHFSRTNNVHEHLLGFICWRAMNNICHRLMTDTGSTKYQKHERINAIAIKGGVAWAWDGKVRIVLWCAVLVWIGSIGVQCLLFARSRSKVAAGRAPAPPTSAIIPVEDSQSRQTCSWVACHCRWVTDCFMISWYVACFGWLGDGGCLRMLFQSSLLSRFALQMGGVDENGWYSKNGALVQRSKETKNWQRERGSQSC